jgi:hypothetical protein
MIWRLFFTLVAAGLCIYFLIRWLNRHEMSLVIAGASKGKKEIGFAAIAKQRELEASENLPALA